MYNRGAYTGHWRVDAEGVEPGFWAQPAAGKTPCQCAGPPEDSLDSSEDEMEFLGGVDGATPQASAPEASSPEYFTASDAAQAAAEAAAAAAASAVYVCTPQARLKVVGERTPGAGWTCVPEPEWREQQRQYQQKQQEQQNQQEQQEQQERQEQQKQQEQPDGGRQVPEEADVLVEDKGGAKGDLVRHDVVEVNGSLVQRASDADGELLYKEWLDTHGGSVATVPPAQVFKDVLALIRQHSESEHAEHYSLTHNTRAAAHMETAHTARVKLSTNRYWLTHPQSYVLTQARAKAAKLPPRKSWVSMLSKPKDQEQCGSCWIFSATAVMESFYARSNPSKRVVLDEQTLINQHNGCEGGDPGDLLEVVLSHQGGMALGRVVVEETGAGRGAVLNMSLNKGALEPVPLGAISMNVVQLKDDDTLAEREEAFMRALVEHGPLCAGVSSQSTWNLYEKGIIMPPKEYGIQDLNHAVCIVGYDCDSKGRGTWIMRNCWGEDWGEGGYFRLPRGPKWGKSKKWGRDGPFGLLAFPSQYLV